MHQFRFLTWWNIYIFTEYMYILWCVTLVLSKKNPAFSCLKQMHVLSGLFKRITFRSKPYRWWHAIFFSSKITCSFITCLHTWTRLEERGILLNCLATSQKQFCYLKRGRLRYLCVILIKIIVLLYFCRNMEKKSIWHLFVLHRPHFHLVNNSQPIHNLLLGTNGLLTGGWLCEKK